MNNKAQQKILSKMLNDAAIRRAVVRRSHQWFFYFYFGEYVEYEAAPFHRDFFQLTEDEDIRTIVLSAFRGSAKSTIFSMSFPLWAIIGNLNIKHIIIASATVEKAERLLGHMRAQLESNALLKRDLGPFKEERSPWNTKSILISRYGARITAVSRDQSIRSIRHNQYRPQLVIVDDLEDIESVHTQEMRDKIDKWMTSDVIPAGDKKTRLVFVGTPLHQDSVFMRFRSRIEQGRMSGVFRMYPIYNDKQESLWPGKFPDMQSIEEEKMRGVTDVEFRREYLLEIVPDENQIIKEEWIRYYDEVPETKDYADYRFAITSVDPAMSEKQSADCTAIVSAQVFGHGEKRRIFILPYPINERMEPLDTIKQIINRSFGLGKGVPTKVIVEDVGAQKLFPALLSASEIPAVGVPVAGHDKRGRLMLTAPFIQSGGILFHKTGNVELIRQILGFGVEKHDDLVDALTLIILFLIKEDNMGWIRVPGMPSSEPPTRTEEEKDADIEMSLYQEAQRSRDKTAWQKYFAFVNERRGKYWRGYELGVYNRIKRRF